MQLSDHIKEMLKKNMKDEDILKILGTELLKQNRGGAGELIHTDDTCIKILNAHDEHKDPIKTETMIKLRFLGLVGEKIANIYEESVGSDYVNLAEVLDTNMLLIEFFTDDFKETLKVIVKSVKSKMELKT